MHVGALYTRSDTTFPVLQQVLASRVLLMCNTCVYIASMMCTMDMHIHMLWGIAFPDQIVDLGSDPSSTDKLCDSVIVTICIMDVMIPACIMFICPTCLYIHRCPCLRHTLPTTPMVWGCVPAAGVMHDIVDLHSMDMFNSHISDIGPTMKALIATFVPGMAPVVVWIPASHSNHSYRNRYFSKLGPIIM